MAVAFVHVEHVERVVACGRYRRATPYFRAAVLDELNAPGGPCGAAGGIDWERTPARASASRTRYARGIFHLGGEFGRARPLDAPCRRVEDAPPYQPPSCPLPHTALRTTRTNTKSSPTLSELRRHMSMHDSGRYCSAWRVHGLIMPTLAHLSTEVETRTLYLVHS